MYCPEQVVLDTKLLFLMCHTKADYYQGAPLRELLNPLRYSITIFPGTNYRKTVNGGGKAWRNFSDWMFAIKQRIRR